MHCRISPLDHHAHVFELASTVPDARELYRAALGIQGDHTFVLHELRATHSGLVSRPPWRSPLSTH